MPSRAALNATQKRINKAIFTQRNIAERSVTLASARNLSRYFAGMSTRLESRLRKRFPDAELKEAAVAGDFDFAFLDWNAEEAELRKVVQRTYIGIAETAFNNVAEVAGLEVAFDLNGRNIQNVMSAVGPLVKGINEESRDRLRSIVQTGINNGDSPARVARTMLESTRGWAGLEDLKRSRAMTIARTETAHAYNLSSLAAYEDSRIIKKVICLDSPDCGWNGHNDSQLANGTERTFLEARSKPTSHPNCVRAFAPKVAGRD